MQMSSINSNTMQFIVLGYSHSRNPYQEVDLEFVRGTGRIKQNVLLTSIFRSEEIISLSNSSNSQKVSNSLAG